MADTNDELELDNPDLVQWSPRHGPTFGETPLLRVSIKPSLIRPSSAVGASAVGATAVGALAIGALSIGALAIGRLVVGRASFKDVRIGRLVVDELVVRRRTDEA